jgi:hypothetical protein
MERPGKLQFPDGEKQERFPGYRVPRLFHQGAEASRGGIFELVASLLLGDAMETRATRGLGAGNFNRLLRFPGHRGERPLAFPARARGMSSPRTARKDWVVTGPFRWSSRGDGERLLGVRLARPGAVRVRAARWRADAVGAIWRPRSRRERGETLGPNGPKR